MIQEGSHKAIMDLPIIFNLRLKVDSKSRVQLAYGNSVVASLKFRRAHLIAHFDCSGRLLTSLQVENFIHFTMLNEETTIILSEDKQKVDIALTIWNLVSGKTYFFTLPQAKLTQASRYSMFVFKNTKIFCFCHYTMKMLQLFYYRLPILQDDDPFHVYFLPNAQQNLSFFKLNEHSMIGLIPAKPAYNTSNQVDFQTYSLKRNGVGGLFSHRFSYQDTAEVALQIKDVWEIKPNIVYIQCEDSNQRLRLRQRTVEQAQQLQQYYTFYASFQRKSLIKSKLNAILTQPHRIQFINSLRMLNTVQDIYVGELNKYMPKNVPVYYVNPINQEIVSKYLGEYHKFGYGNFCWPSYQAGSVLEYEFDFYEGQMNVKVRLYCPTWQGIKVITTFFLNQIIENSNDDLLDAVCGMVSEEEQYTDPYNYLQELSKNNSKF